MGYLNLASIRICTEAEGPGRRFAVWCQGCQRNCPGCCNPEMQAMVQNRIVSVEDLQRIILQSKKTNQIEGVSLIGGEPLLQAQGISELAEWCQSNGLTVLLFTGYTYEKIQEMKHPYVMQLLQNVDLLVDGPYLEEEYDMERDWVGSKNQNVIYLSDAYEKGVEYEKREHSVEIMVSDTDILLNGWPYDV